MVHNTEHSTQIDWSLLGSLFCCSSSSSSATRCMTVANAMRLLHMFFMLLPSAEHAIKEVIRGRAEMRHAKSQLCTAITPHSGEAAVDLILKLPPLLLFLGCMW